jgi:hypothetical protein
LSSSRMNFHLKHPHNPDSQGFEPLVKADDARYVGAWVAMVQASLGSSPRS